MITTSYYYATKVYKRMKLQSLLHLEHERVGEVDIQLPQDNRLCGDSVSNLVNIYLHNQAFYLTMVHTSSSSLNDLKDYLLDQ
eukprot:1741942-Amphidinium_carterae.2